MTTLEVWMNEQRAANPLWPWPTVDPNDPNSGVVWPIASERDRMARYRQMEQAYEGKHWDVFEVGKYAKADHEAMARRNYITMNYVRVALREVLNIKSGSLLEVTAGGALAEEMATETDADDLVREVMRDRMRLGDGAVLVRRLSDGTCSLELLDPAITYPITMPDSRTTLLEVRVAYELMHGDDRFLYLVSHRAGEIHHSLWMIDGGVLRPYVFGSCPYAQALAGAGPNDHEVTVPTPSPDLMTVQWTPREPQGDVYGDPLCLDALQAQMLLNTRETQRHRRLLAMDNPMLVVSDTDTNQVLDSQGAPTGRRTFRYSASEVIVRGEDDNSPPPQWIGGDTNLDANEHAQDDARRAFAMMSGISVGSITQDPDAMAAASGESLRMRMLPTVLTAEQEAREACKAVANAIRLAVWWQHNEDPGEVECDLPTGSPYAESNDSVWPTPTNTASPFTDSTQQENDLFGSAPATMV